MAGLLPAGESALAGFADMLYSGARYIEAAHYYEKGAPNDAGTLVKEAQCLFLGEKADEALEALESKPHIGGLHYKEILLECLKVVKPNSSRISPLDREVLDIKVETALDKEVTQTTQHTNPIVHGM